MTLCDRIKLINDLIRKRPDTRIIDYVLIVADMDNKTEDMGSRKNIANLTADQRMEIIRLVKFKSVAQVCEIMDISPDCIYKTCQREAESIRAIIHPEVKKSKIRDPVMVHSNPKTRIERPPSEYSNIKSNYLTS